jgi:uncharacterized membrane protein
MPEITWFGWVHTAAGVLALLFGFYTLAKNKVIRLSDLPGKTYLMLTLIAATSALGIYKHGGFGVAHALAVLTVLAVTVGAIAEQTQVFGGVSRYLQAASYSATLLFHMIPAITDGLMRLPVDGPVVTDLHDPLLRGFYIAFLLAYLIGLLLQVLWLKRNAEAG